MDPHFPGAHLSPVGVRKTPGEAQLPPCLWVAVDKGCGELRLDRAECRGRGLPSHGFSSSLTQTLGAAAENSQA